MTPVSTGLTILGLIALFWPLTTLLFKRNVLNAQWLMMLAMSMLALTFILLGCLFNTFLMGEILILMLFLDIIILTPPILHIALSVLTTPNSELHSPKFRLLLLPSLLCIALMIVSSFIGGADTFRLWTLRGAQGLSWSFLPGNWRYNLIVFANSYLFWAVFGFEFLFILVNSIRQFFRFRRISAEYYSSDLFRNLNLKGFYLAANLGFLIMALSQIFNPFAPGRSLQFYFLYCAPLALILFYIGRSVYMISDSAERLPQSSRPRSSRKNTSLARQIEDFVETQQAFLNFDLSVFLLADHFAVSQDEIVDAVHQLHGASFGDYIDSLRVAHAVRLLTLSHKKNDDDPSSLLQLAHQCGYLDSEALKKAFKKQMGSDIAEWQ